MTGKVIASALATAAAACAASWWWFVRCRRSCADADREARELFEGGEPLSALALIESADRRCHCSRFTSGDAPPQYSLARACLRQLLAEGRRREAEELLARARSPILRELAERPGDHRP